MPKIVVLLALAAAARCRGFSPQADGAAPGDGPAAGEGQRSEARASDARSRETGEPPLEGPCRELVLPCLDPADAKVIEVPAEATAQAAFAAAKAGDTIQIRGLSVGAGWAIPPYVTLRGCAGARITGGIRFAGSGGTVEGFEVSGQIVANESGSYVVRYNRFVGGGAASEAGVSARAVDGLVSAAVVALVESNWFAARSRGLEARTKYDTGVHSVELTARNNIFSGVDYPIDVSEGGMVGKIAVVLEHNTLHAFKTGVALFGMGGKSALRGNLLAVGELGVGGDSPFELEHCMGWQLKTAHSQPPLAGALAVGDPAFVDAAGGDLRLGAASAAIDRVPAGAPVPTEDYQGCPRPVAFLGGEARADIGALERQR
jgi:hypothetical protein